MARGGISRSVTAVVGDLTTGLCGEAAPRARAGSRHLTLVPRLQAEPDTAGIEDSLEQLGRKLDELARLYAAAGMLLRNA